jgi:hypothetical protein
MENAQRKGLLCSVFNLLVRCTYRIIVFFNLSLQICLLYPCPCTLVSSLNRLDYLAQTKVNLVVIPLQRFDFDAWQWRAEVALRITYVHDVQDFGTVQLRGPARLR